MQRVARLPTRGIRRGPGDPPPPGGARCTSRAQEVLAGSGRHMPLIGRRAPDFAGWRSGVEVARDPRQQGAAPGAPASTSSRPRRMGRSADDGGPARGTGVHAPVVLPLQQQADDPAARAHHRLGQPGERVPMPLRTGAGRSDVRHRLAHERTVERLSRHREVVPARVTRWIRNVHLIDFAEAPLTRRARAPGIGGPPVAPAERVGG